MIGYNSNNYYLLVFSSRNQAIYLYGTLTSKGYNVEMVSTPCTISSGCTQSIKFPKEYMQAVLNQARIMNMNIKGVYKIVIKDNKETYQLVQEE